MKKLSMTLVMVLMLFTVMYGNGVRDGSSHYGDVTGIGGSGGSSPGDNKIIIRDSALIIKEGVVKIADSSVTFTKLDETTVVAEVASLANGSNTTRELIKVLKQMYDVDGVVTKVKLAKKNSSYPPNGAIKAGDIPANFTIKFQAKRTHKFRNGTPPTTLTFRIMKTVDEVN